MYRPVTGNSQSPGQKKALLARLGCGRPLELKRSDNPLAAIWRDLQRYAGAQRAQRIFDPSIPIESVRTFCAYLELADSYAAVAEEAEISLDPLLLYYAAMWLARGVIAVRLGIPAAAQVKAHGSRSLPKVDGDLRLLGGTVTLSKNGTLPRLSEALGGDCANGVTFSLLELLQVFPEMDDVLAETIGLRTAARPIHVHDDYLQSVRSAVSNIQIDLVGTTLDDVNMLPISPALQARNAQVVEIPGAASLLWATETSVEADIATLFMRTANGYYTEPRIKGIYVPELVAYLAVLHALSQFTRYYPREWLDVIGDHGADFALIREFMHFAERKVPELVLNELSGCTIVYRHA